MTPTDDPLSLGNLHDIVEPLSVAMWPPAAGFWMLLGLLAIWGAAFLALAAVNYRSKAYRREALAELAALRGQFPSVTDSPRLLREITLLLKRVAITGFGRERVAPLSGAELLRFLDDTGGGGEFNNGPAKLLAVASYDGHAAEGLSHRDRASILAATELWIRRHRLAGSD